MIFLNKKKCEVCLGVGQFIGAGHVTRKCSKCGGAGSIEIEPERNMDKLLGVENEFNKRKVVDVNTTAKDMPQIAEIEQPKRKGRPPKLTDLNLEVLKDE